MTGNSYFDACALAVRFFRSSLLETAPFQERFDVGIAPGRVVKKFHRVVAAASGKKGVAEVIAVGASETAVLLKPFDRVRVQDLAPDI